LLLYSSNLLLGFPTGRSFTTHNQVFLHHHHHAIRWRFPSPAGCREELLDPPELRVNGGGGSRCVLFWKSDQVLRFFPSGGLYRRRGVVRSGPGGAHRGRGPVLGRAPWWCGPPVAPLHRHFGSLEASVNIWTSGFCFVQFREYFLCNFSETQKQHKTGNWHCGISLIG
jgi:hypothetical protein